MVSGCSLLFAEDFSIMDFSDPYKYEWYNAEDRYTFRDSLSQSNLLLEDYLEIRQSPLTNALKTAVAPGWGHFSVKSYTKGQILLGSQLALLGTTLYFYERSMIHYRKYKKATQIDEIDEHYNNALIPYRQSNLFIGLFIVVWGYSIYDVINETNQYNYERWRELNERENSYEISISPNGVSFRF
jgi:hypothetical protein